MAYTHTKEHGNLFNDWDPVKHIAALQILDCHHHLRTCCGASAGMYQHLSACASLSFDHLSQSRGMYIHGPGFMVHIVHIVVLSGDRWKVVESGAWIVVLQNMDGARR